MTASLVTLALKGVAMGMAIAAPVGPIGILCVRRTVAGGMRSGLASGLGAATADGVYGCIAGLGLSAIATALTGAQRWLGIGGGIFLVYLGLRTLGIRWGIRWGGRLGVRWEQRRGESRGEPRDESQRDHPELPAMATEMPTTGDRPPLWQDWATTFGLTLTNPVTILAFVGAFAGLGLGAERPEAIAALVLVVGVFCGSALWWLILSAGVSRFRRLLTPSRMRWIDWISGTLITGFGLGAIVSGLRG